MSIEERFRNHEQVLAAMRRGVRRALWRHKQLGESVAVYRDGRTVILKPEEIPVDSPE